MIPALLCRTDQGTWPTCELLPREPLSITSRIRAPDAAQSYDRTQCTWASAAQHEEQPFLLASRLCCWPLRRFLGRLSCAYEVHIYCLRWTQLMWPTGQACCNIGCTTRNAAVSFTPFYRRSASWLSWPVSSRSDRRLADAAGRGGLARRRQAVRVSRTSSLQMSALSSMAQRSSCRVQPLTHRVRRRVAHSACRRSQQSVRHAAQTQSASALHGQERRSQRAHSTVKNVLAPDAQHIAADSGAATPPPPARSRSITE